MKNIFYYSFALYVIYSVFNLFTEHFDGTFVSYICKSKFKKELTTFEGKS